MGNNKAQNTKAPLQLIKLWNAWQQTRLYRDVLQYRKTAKLACVSADIVARYIHKGGKKYRKENIWVYPRKYPGAKRGPAAYRSTGGRGTGKEYLFG